MKVKKAREVKARRTRTVAREAYCSTKSICPIAQLSNIIVQKMVNKNAKKADLTKMTAKIWKRNQAVS